MGNLLNKNYKLKKADNSIPYYSLKNKSFIGKIVNIYDGDTCTIVIKNQGQLQKYKVRMNGYDSPEMKPKKNILNREKIKEKAIEAKNALKNKINDKLIIIECGDWDKYGRLLGTLFTIKRGKKDININKWMINNNYGYEYHGGKKK